MFFQKELKNLRIVVFVIVACLVAGAALFISSREKVRPQEKENLFAGIEVIETETGKIVRNTAEGYEVTVPKGWWVERGVTDKKQVLYSPEVPPEGLIKGCKIEQGVIKKDTTIDELKEESQTQISELFNPEDIEIDNYETIEINGRQALKHVFKTYMGYSISISIPINGKLYNIVMFMAEPDIERCNQYLNDLLKTISIK